MVGEGQRGLQLNEERLASLLQEAFPAVEVRSPLYENLGVRLQIEVASYAGRAPAGQMTSVPRAPVAPSMGRARNEPGLLTVLKRLLSAWWYAPALATVAAVVLLAVMSALVSNRQTLTTTTAMIEIQAGAVQVSGGGRETSTLKQGDRVQLRVGDVVEASGDGRGVITYFPGQTTEIGAQTRIEIVKVVAAGQNITEAMARLLQGSAVNRLSQPLPPGSSFIMASPSLKASAHGTEFRMVTISSSQTYLATDQGQVEIEAGGVTAQVHAGEQVLAIAGRDLRVTAQPVGQATWIVQPGDTLWQIAGRYGLTTQDLADANLWIWNPDLILPGWKLIVPKK